MKQILKKIGLCILVLFACFGMNLEAKALPDTYPAVQLTVTPALSNVGDRIKVTFKVTNVGDDDVPVHAIMGSIAFNIGIYVFDGFDADNAAATTNVSSSQVDITPEIEVPSYGIVEYSFYLKSIAETDQTHGSDIQVNMARVPPFKINSIADGNRYASVGTFTTTVLPITLTSFTAQKEKDNNAIVKWTVTGAKNFSHFELERSADGKTFTKVSAQAYDAKKPAYSYVDQNLVPGVYQYRLNMVDIDGSQKHSATKEVKIEKTANMTITPNPARDVVYVRGAKEGSVIRIMDIKGGLVQELRLTNASMPVNVAKLAPAAYVVQVIESGNVAGTMQMIKQ